MQAVDESGLIKSSVNNSLAEVMEAVRTEPGRYYNSPEELVADVERVLHEGMQENIELPINIVSKTHLRSVHKAGHNYIEK